MRGDGVVIFVVCVLAIAGFFGLLWVAPRRRRAPPRRGRSYRRLGVFLQRVRAVLEAEDMAALPELRWAGDLRSGRRGQISIEITPLATRVRVTVSTTRTLPPLSVRLEGAMERLKKHLGSREDVHTGDSTFDQRFWLESATPVEGRRALKGRDVRRAIHAAFSRFGVERLDLRPGELTAVVDLSVCPPATWKPLLVHLDQAALLFETRAVRVRVLDAERAAVCDAEGRVRCAYCRDGLTGDEDDLVACERCRTAVHGACWDEHGGCPMLGCEGDQAERPRVRG